MKLNKHNAIGIAAFQYWHTCPKCGYLWITETAKFCGGCGRKIKFFTPQQKDKI